MTGGMVRSRSIANLLLFDKDGLGLLDLQIAFQRADLHHENCCFPDSSKFRLILWGLTWLHLHRCCFPLSSKFRSILGGLRRWWLRLHRQG